MRTRIIEQEIKVQERTYEDEEQADTMIVAIAAGIGGFFILMILLVTACCISRRVSVFISTATKDISMTHTHAESCHMTHVY